MLWHVSTINVEESSTFFVLCGPLFIKFLKFKQNVTDEKRITLRVKTLADIRKHNNKNKYDTYYVYFISNLFRFVASVCVNNETTPIATASGRTKKEAKRLAADNAVQLLMHMDEVSM